MSAFWYDYPNPINKIQLREVIVLKVQIANGIDVEGGEGVNAGVGEVEWIVNKDR